MKTIIISEINFISVILVSSVTGLTPSILGLQKNDKGIKCIGSRKKEWWGLNWRIDTISSAIPNHSDICQGFGNRVTRNSHFGTTFSRFQISFLDQWVELLNVKFSNPLFSYWRRIEYIFRKSKIKMKRAGTISSLFHPKRSPTSEKQPTPI